jgi:hypothetical protein
MNKDRVTITTPIGLGNRPAPRQEEPLVCPPRAMCYIPNVYAGPSALTCVLAASNAGRAMWARGGQFQRGQLMVRD